MQKKYRFSKKQEGTVLNTVGGHPRTGVQAPLLPQVVSTLDLDGYGWQ